MGHREMTRGRITLERPGERKRWRMPPDRVLAVGPTPLVATRGGKKPQDGFVHAGRARRRNDLAASTAHDGRVCADVPSKQHVPVGHSRHGAQQIRSHCERAARRRTEPPTSARCGEDPNEAGLHRTAGPDDRQESHRLGREADVLQEADGRSRRGRHRRGPRSGRPVGLGNSRARPRRGRKAKTLGEFARVRVSNQTPPGRYGLPRPAPVRGRSQRRREDDAGLNGPSTRDKRRRR